MTTSLQCDQIWLFCSTSQRQRSTYSPLAAGTFSRSTMTARAREGPGSDGRGRGREGLRRQLTPSVHRLGRLRAVAQVPQLLSVCVPRW